jgi:hypothetical protein
MDTFWSCIEGVVTFWSYSRASKILELFEESIGYIQVLLPEGVYFLELFPENMGYILELLPKGGNILELYSESNCRAVHIG